MPGKVVKYSSAIARGVKRPKRPHICRQITVLPPCSRKPDTIPFTAVSYLLRGVEAPATGIAAKGCASHVHISISGQLRRVPSNPGCRHTLKSRCPGRRYATKGVSEGTSFKVKELRACNFNIVYFPNFERLVGRNIHTGVHFRRIVFSTALVGIRFLVE